MITYRDLNVKKPFPTIKEGFGGRSAFEARNNGVKPRLQLPPLLPHYLKPFAMPLRFA